VTEAEAAGSGSRGGGRPWLVVGALAVLLVVGLAGYRQWRVRTGVEILLDAEPLRCEGTTIDRAPSAGDDEFLVPLAVAAPGMFCQYRFFVQNSSGRDIRIERIDLPQLGPGGGTAVVATHLDPIRNEDSGPQAGQVDARWVVDDELIDGDRFDYAIWIEFRPGGCLPEGGSISLAGPTVTARLSGLEHTVEPPVPTIGFVGTASTSCDA
jgi:hypothetical protein